MWYFIYFCHLINITLNPSVPSIVSMRNHAQTTAKKKGGKGSCKQMRIALVLKIIVFNLYSSTTIASSVNFVVIASAK